MTNHGILVFKYAVLFFIIFCKTVKKCLTNANKTGFHLKVFAQHSIYGANFHDIETCWRKLIYG